jgi:hypothetical protein
MDPVAAKRVAKIKAAVQSERKLIAELAGQISEGRARDLLKPASNLLDDVEEFFLNAKTLAETRAPDRMAAWLDGAELVLRDARECRDTVQGLVAEFGPDMKVVG